MKTAFLWLLDFLGALLTVIFLAIVGLIPFLLAVLLCSCSSFDPPEPGEGSLIILESGEGVLIYSPNPDQKKSP